MITAIDLSALIAVFLGEHDSDAWMDLMVKSRREGSSLNASMHADGIDVNDGLDPFG